MMKHIEPVVRAVLNGPFWKATKYVSPKIVITATQRRYRGDRLADLGDREVLADIVLTIGRPNYLQRQFIADCKKAGCPFPIRKIQLKGLPKRRAS